ncbi:MAG: SGNH/GDSL hydrolase family protein [Planctomycetota bacterium]
MAPLQGSQTLLLWREATVHPFRLAGFPWFEQDRVFRRAPLAPLEKLPDAVDWLADCPAGGQVAFQTDSRHVAVRVTLAAPADMSHMPATGQCGFDLYVGPPFAKRFHNVSKYDHRQTTYEVLLFEHADAAMRAFTLNFPLYQAVKDLRIGLDAEARVSPPPPYSIEGRIAVYGTSITQGGCASRPGMAYTNIMSRLLNAEVVNWGFSGSGKGEPEVCRCFASIPDARLFVLDYEANAGNLDQYRKTLPENIRILRNRRRDVPILVMSRIAFSKDIADAKSLREREQSRDMQTQLVENAGTQGDRLIYFLDGSTLLGHDFDECTVDGIHPTDLGFLRIAQGVCPAIRKILKEENR